MKRLTLLTTTVLLLASIGSAQTPPAAAPPATPAAAPPAAAATPIPITDTEDRKSTRLNSSHSQISYAVFCLKKKNLTTTVACSIATREPRQAVCYVPMASTFRRTSKHCWRLPTHTSSTPPMPVTTLLATLLD